MAAGARPGRVTRVTGDEVYVELPEVAPGFEFGPCLDVIGGLAVGDKVLTQPLARDEDDLAIVGRIGGPPAGTPGSDHDHDDDYAPVDYEQVFTFATPAAVWDCHHNTGRLVEVETYDNTGEPIVGDVTRLSSSVVRVAWYFPTSGTARVHT